MSQQKVEKRGRKKKAPIEVSKNETINVKNVIPPSAIEHPGKKPVCNLDVFSLYLELASIDTLISFIEVINGICDDSCNIGFDEYGIIFQKKNGEDCQFEARIFAEKMSSFYCKTNVSLKLDQNYMFKCLKNLKSDDPFIMYIYNGENTINLETYNDKSNLRRTYTLSYTSIENIEMGFSQVLNANTYESIVVLNSSFFSKECGDMKGISSEFNIYCDDSTFRVEIDKKDLVYRGVQGQSEYIKFVKKPTTPNSIMNKTLSTKLINDYIKCQKFSKFVKFYFTQQKDIPTIVEYDIDPDFGVFQAFLY